MAEEPVPMVVEAAETTKGQPRVRPRFARDHTLTWPDRVMAATAHLAILLSLPGLLYALLLWLVLRGRAPYIAEHARAAFLWQILTNVALFLMIVVLFIAALISLGGTLNVSANDSSNNAGLIGLFGSLLALWIVLIAGSVAAVGSAIIGAIAALLGWTFRYPFINRRRQN